MARSVRSAYSVCSALLAVAVLVPVAAMAQRGAKASSAPSAATTSWDLFGGFSVSRSAPAPAQPNFRYGWDVSIVNRPYPRHPWIGGEINSSGVYGSTPNVTQGAEYLLGSNVYTASAGPVVQTPGRYVRLFAHALVGGAAAGNSIVATIPVPVRGTNGYFSTTGGGGVDFFMTRHAGVRAKADWNRVWQVNDPSTNNKTNVDAIRLSGGVIYSF